VAIDAEGDDLHVGLIYIFLIDEVDAGLGISELIVASRLRVTGGRLSKAARILASMATGSKSP